MVCCRETLSSLDLVIVVSNFGRNTTRFFTWPMPTCSARHDINLLLFQDPGWPKCPQSSHTYVNTALFIRHHLFVYFPLPSGFKHSGWKTNFLFIVLLLSVWDLVYAQQKGIELWVECRGKKNYGIQAVRECEKAALTNTETSQMT